MASLSEFLLKRIEDDEWVVEQIEQGGYQLADSQPYALSPCYDDEGPLNRADVHPWRLKAECEAKRRIVERITHGCSHPPRAGGWCIEYCDATLRDLALPHADHPDFQQEWKA